MFSVGSVWHDVSVQVCVYGEMFVLKKGKLISVYWWWKGACVLYVQRKQLMSRSCFLGGSFFCVCVCVMECQNNSIHVHVYKRNRSYMNCTCCCTCTGWADKPLQSSEYCIIIFNPTSSNDFLWVVSAQCSHFSTSSVSPCIQCYNCQLLRLYWFCSLPGWSIGTYMYKYM